MGSCPRPQLPFPGTRKVSLRASSPLQLQGIGVLPPCGCRAPGAVCLGLIPALISSTDFQPRSSPGEHTAPSTVLRSSALSLLFLASSRLPG